MFKKHLSILLIIVLVLSAAPTSVFAADTYLSRTQTAEMLLEGSEKYENEITQTQLLTGLGQDKDDYINRIDFLVMLAKAFNNMPEMSEYQASKVPENVAYTDIPDWAEESVDLLISKGILTGSNNNLLKPDENISTDEVDMYLKRVWNLYGSNPADDFYSYIAENKIERNSEGYFTDASNEVEKFKIYLLYDICIRGNAQNETEEKILRFYNALTNFDAKDKRGVAPIKQYIDAINNAKNHKQLEEVLVKIENEQAYGPLFNLSIGTDYNDNTKKVYFFSVYPPTFTTDELAANYDTLKNAFIDYAALLFEASGQSKEKAKSNAEYIFKLEEDLAKHSKSLEDSNNYSGNYNLTSFSEIDEKTLAFDMNNIYEAMGADTQKKLYMPDKEQTEYFLSTYCDGNHLEDLKLMSLLSLMAVNSDLLSSDIWAASLRFENITSGSEGYNVYDDETLIFVDALETVESYAAGYIDEMYCTLYYDDETTAVIEEMAEDIISKYEENIKNCTWMSDETKAKAIIKLKAIDVRVGRPDEFYSSALDYITVYGDNVLDAAFKNSTNAYLASKKASVEAINEPVDRSGWDLYGYTVNGTYIPTSNVIYITAGLLQEPIYSPNDSYEEVLAKVGCIVAHEVSHAFDRQGSGYDENGNYNNWWTEEDKAKFDEITQKIIDYYDGYEAYNGIATNGSLSAGENFADICGMACVLSILKDKENVDYEAFFESFAKVFYNDFTYDYEEYAKLADVHARGRARINRMYSCFDEFYNTYNVGEGDGMYVPKEERIKIW